MVTKYMLRVTFQDNAQPNGNRLQTFNHDSLATLVAGRDAMTKHPKAKRIETWAHLETWERTSDMGK